MSCSEECKHPCYECQHNSIRETIHSIHDNVARESYCKALKDILEWNECETRQVTQSLYLTPSSEGLIKHIKSVLEEKIKEWE